jgi:hypothetical protein
MEATTWRYPLDYVRRGRWTRVEGPAAATTMPQHHRLDPPAGGPPPALAQRAAGRRLALTAPRLAIPALVVVAVAFVAAADRLASSGPLGFAAAAALLLGAPALVAGLLRLSVRRRSSAPSAAQLEAGRS